MTEKGFLMHEIVSDLLGIEGLVKEVHWNSYGTNFITLHRYLDEVYDSCEEYIDEIAEYMVASDPDERVLWSPNVISSFLMEEETDITHGVNMVVAVLNELVFALDAAIADADDDPAGQDILVRALQDFNKHRWLLGAEMGTYGQDR